MVRVASLLALLLACGPQAGHPPSTAERDIGGFTLGDMEVRFTAKKTVQVFDRCEQSILPSPPCTSAEIETELHITASDGPVTPAAYLSNWTPRSRFIVAERAGGSFEAIDARADALLHALHVESCSDSRHVAYMVDGPDDGVEGLFSLLTRVDGGVLGSYPATGGERCEAALAAAAATDRQLADDLATGNRPAFDALVRAGALAPALDFSLAHTFEIDAFRESHPTIDDVFFEKLAARLDHSPAFVATVGEKITSPAADYPRGRRGGGTLEGWLRRVVRAFPPDPRGALLERLTPLCAAGSSTCPPWRLHALLTAALALPPERRCELAAPFVARRSELLTDAQELLVLTLAETLTDCDAATTLAADVLAAPASFPINDAESLYPPCIDAIGTGTDPLRCGSAPTLAVLLAKDPCDERLLRAARTAGESTARAWQLAAIGVHRRCGRTPELQTLVEKLRPTPPFNTRGFDYFAHTFPPPTK